ncbi:O-antigen ligase family protein [Empedobacter sp. ULE_I140]|mgnify:CR=1 FL=1
MMISKEKFNLINNYLLVVILCTLFFRSVSTLLIFVFAGFNLFNYKYLKFNTKYLFILVVLTLPFLLEILFLWNNIGSGKLLKPIEKVISFFIFPFFILMNPKGYSIYKISDLYRKFMTLLIIILLIRFLIIAPEYVSKYVRGVHLWEMGYVISNSFGNHAPVVNMHIAFVVVLNLYFLLKNYPQKVLMNISFLIMSVIALFIINTRLALGSCIICCFIVVFSYAYKKYNKKSIYAIISFVVLTVIILLTAFATNPYMKEKYSEVTFANMDKVGRLDEVENPDNVLHNALVTRVSIWKSATELGYKRVFTGYGSANSKEKLVEYFKDTNQQFLTKYKFPVHNQFFDYFLRFGIIGFVGLLFYFFTMFRISFFSKNLIGSCFVLNFLFSNLFDDFLIRFQGIVYSAIWFSLIVSTATPILFFKSIKIQKSK